ncbi:MAG: Crp/Fnr family transcriptional regulator [Gemmobacter sp.]|nr:Crp/Fnr family transcriptional regulator [Gemmobacter sp.]
MSITTDCADCPLRKMKLFLPFTPEELEFMRHFKTGEVTVPRGATILSQGERSATLYTVLSGLGTRSVMLEDGRRQVINFAFPGDFLGLQAGIMGEMRHTVNAITPMTLCAFSRDRVWELFQNQPARAYDLTWIAAVEEHFLGETIVTLGQRDATERMAWAYVRIWRRLSAVGLAKNDGVPLPFRQHDLADALGMSLVHTNRVVAALRRAGLATWSNGWLQLHNLAALSALAGIPMEKEEQRPIM